MIKKKLAFFIAFLLAASTFTTMGTINLAEANFAPQVPPINHAYIRSSGEIDPTTLPIQRSGNLYILTDNIVNYTLEVQCDNIIIDGSGFTLQGVSIWGYTGLTLSNIHNVLVKNLKVDRFMNGISLENTLSITLTNNRIDTQTDILAINSNYIQVSENTLAGYGVGVYGQKINNSSFNNNYISAEGTGIDIYSSNYNNITNNLLKNQTSLSIHLGEYGPCNFNLVSDNIIVNGNLGIAILGGSSYNSIIHNNIQTNYSTIIIGNSQNNLFYENNINNSKTGIFIDKFWVYSEFPRSINNIFYLNNFLNNIRP